MTALGIVRRKEAQSITYINLKYSATAGLLYVDNQDVQKEMEEIRQAFRAKFGDGVVPKYDDDVNTKFFCDEMIKRGLIDGLQNGKPDAIAIAGKVTNVQLQQQESANKLETDYLKVTFEVGDGNKAQRLVVSLDFNHKVAQNLIPRLLTIQPGQVAYFCPSPFFRADDTAKKYPVHGVTLNDEDGKPIKRVEGFLGELKKQQDALSVDLEKSGADMNDPDVQIEVRDMVEGIRKAFYLGMFKEVERRFEHYQPGSKKQELNGDEGDSAQESDSFGHANMDLPAAR